MTRRALLLAGLVLAACPAPSGGAVVCWDVTPWGP
jgi:hypothetical protein